MRALILNAGKSTRLDGANKLFVRAGNEFVYNWHLRALNGYKIAVVCRSEDAEFTGNTMTVADRIVAHDDNDGPVGALTEYLIRYHDDTELLVVYADTLIKPQPLPTGDWVGVSRLCDRTWDHVVEGKGWVKEIPELRIGIGMYRFSNLELLRSCIVLLGAARDQHLPPLLNLYEMARPMKQVDIAGWHDAGDWDAINKVPDYDTL